ncbi:hypothetical protein KJ359_007809 [Pestalotiopsis sp. 9143b]|nr:hypothetical protein KJ359_007809 [Pestalotiopsis sp. 9143b]
MHESDADVKASQPQRQSPIFNNWAEGHGLAHLKDSIPIAPRLADVFNKQVEISQIIREGLSAVHAPGQRLTQDWESIALNGIDSKLARFKENLPPVMRLKQWSSLLEPVQPHLAALQAQHGLSNGSLIFVHGIIAAVNTILTLTRGGRDLQSKTYLPDLELALQEISSTWAIAGHALSRLRILLSTMHNETTPTLPSQIKDAPLGFDLEALNDMSDLDNGGSQIAQILDWDYLFAMPSDAFHNSDFIP